MVYCRYRMFLLEVWGCVAIRFPNPLQPRPPLLVDCLPFPLPAILGLVLLQNMHHSSISDPAFGFSLNLFE